MTCNIESDGMVIHHPYGPLATKTTNLVALSEHCHRSDHNKCRNEKCQCGCHLRNRLSARSVRSLSYSASLWIDAIAANILSRAAGLSLWTCMTGTGKLQSTATRRSIHVSTS